MRSTRIDGRAMTLDAQDAKELDALYSDALGPPDSPGGTYPGMIRHNVNVIVEALTK